MARLARKIPFSRQSRFARNFDVVDYLNSAGRLRHSRGGAFVLHDRCGTSPSGDTILDMNLQTVLTDLRLGQFGLDGSFNLGVAVLGLAMRHRERSGRQGPRAGK